MAALNGTQKTGERALSCENVRVCGGAGHRMVAGSEGERGESYENNIK